jgi:hypothetical protein
MHFIDNLDKFLYFLKHLNQGFSTFCRPRAKFTLTCQFAGHKVIKENSLLKLHASILKMLLTNYYKQDHISLNGFLQQTQKNTAFACMIFQYPV